MTTTIREKSMTARKPGLSRARHHEIGLELARIRDRLTTLGVEIANAYPKSSPVSRLALAMPGSVDKARSALDDQACGEYPADPDATCWYYPQSEARWPGRMTSDMAEFDPWQPEDPDELPEPRTLLAYWETANRNPDAQKRLVADRWRLWRLARDLATALQSLIDDEGEPHD
jgi:hypothetical protein